MVDDTETRKLLRSGKHTEALKERAAQFCPWLSPALSYLENFKEVPVWWSRLIKDLGANTPASGMVDTTMESSLDTILAVLEHGVDNSQQFETVSKVCPVLYNILRHDISEEVRSVIIPIFKHIMSKISLELQCKPHARELAADIEEDAVFPWLPQKYLRGLFNMDKGVSTGKVCTKKDRKYKALTPGIFTINCSHGKFRFYAFFVLYCTRQHLRSLTHILFAYMPNFTFGCSMFAAHKQYCWSVQS